MDGIVNFPHSDQVYEWWSDYLYDENDPFVSGVNWGDRTEALDGFEDPCHLWVVGNLSGMADLQDAVIKELQHGTEVSGIFPIEQVNYVWEATSEACKLRPWFLYHCVNSIDRTFVKKNLDLFPKDMLGEWIEELAGQSRRVPVFDIKNYLV